jgi:hypothetical protein
MSANPTPHRCHVKLVGRACEHDLCYAIRRGVPPELRCVPEQPTGYGRGGGGCCRIPDDMADRVERELRDNLQEWKRLGYVLVRAA